MAHRHKAYEDLHFLHSSDARLIRILAEYLEPLRRFRLHKIRDTIVFFGSSRTLPPNEAADRLAEIEAKMRAAKRVSARLKSLLSEAQTQVKMSRYYADAVELARLLTQWAMKLEGPSQRLVVCTGAGGGIMEAANKGASIAGGKTIGLNISMPTQQATNRYVSHDLDFQFHYFFMRKLWFVFPARALIVFPGGFGTADELMEVLTLEQTRKLRKRVHVVLYGSEYWNKVMNFNAMLEDGTIDECDLRLFYLTDTPKDAYNYLRRKLSGG
jgi:uncharacterized protein (TIGR00730 family)